MVRGAWCVRAEFRVWHGRVVEQVRQIRRVRRRVLAELEAAFVCDDCQEALDYLSMEVHPMVGHCFAEDMSAFVVPVAGLARGTEGVFIEPRLVLAGPAAVALGDIAADRSGRTVQLISQTDGPLVA